MPISAIMHSNVDIIIVLLLILLNGIFVTAELAIISSRKHKLKQLANDGSSNAKVALELAENPNRILSTAQIGITLISILTGVFGGEALSEHFAVLFQAIPFIAPYSEQLGLLIVVICITYLTLVIGELVPKRVALSDPEGIAMFFAFPIKFLSSLLDPIVVLLSISTEWILRIFRVKEQNGISVSEDEIRTLVREGAKAGVLEFGEREILERTLGLGDKKVSSLMTPRKEMVWFDVDGTYRAIRSKLVKNPHPYFPVCEGSIDKVVGVVRAEDLLIDYVKDEKFDLKKELLKPLFVPTTMDALDILDLFKSSGIHLAMVVDEYGNIEGLVSLTDILEAIVGDIPAVDELDDSEITKREDGSWLVDGAVSVHEFKEHFKLKKMPGEKSGGYNTLAGFIVYKLEKIPITGDAFEWDRFRFEVADMDGNRVDKILMHMKQD
jgi:putative hemolysin